MPKIRTEPVKRVYLTVPLTMYKRVAHAAGDMPVATYLVREALPKMLGDPEPSSVAGTAESYRRLGNAFAAVAKPMGVSELVAAAMRGEDIT